MSKYLFLWLILKEKLGNVNLLPYFSGIDIAKSVLEMQKSVGIFIKFFCLVHAATQVV